MLRASLITGFIALALLLTLAFVGTGDRWPAAEQPPRQGEALDAGALSAGSAVHSEQALARLVREPQNTWSNLAFVFAGALLFSTCKTRTGKLAGVMLILTGVGSFLYHASASRTLRHTDVAGMYGLYFVAGFLCLCTLKKTFFEKIEKLIGFVAGVTICLGIFAAGARNFSILGFKPFALTLVTGITATALIGTLTLAIIRNRNLKVTGLAGAAILCFALAVICQTGDRPGNFLCNPSALIQAHALWHIFAATAFTLSVFAIEASKQFSNRISPCPPNPR